MKKEEQQKAIAEFCGWANCLSPMSDEYHFLTTQELGNAMGRPVGRNSLIHPDGQHHRIPDYPNDLNAMHDAEKVLRPSQKIKYLKHLTQLDYYGRFATATQRAEAFLKTIGKWEDECYE